MRSYRLHDVPKTQHVRDNHLGPVVACPHCRMEIQLAYRHGDKQPEPPVQSPPASTETTVTHIDVAFPLLVKFALKVCVAFLPGVLLVALVVRWLFF
jgi:hypothetical protein